MKTSELTGALLDLWVARAEGKCYTQSPGVWGNALINELGRLSIAKNSWDCARYFEPSTNWAHGGPIFEREGFGICKFYEPTDGPIPDGGEWCALWRDDSMRADGPTPLIAGMRLFVMSKFGEEVPDEQSEL